MKILKTAELAEKLNIKPINLGKPIYRPFYLVCPFGADEQNIRDAGITSHNEFKSRYFWYVFDKETADKKNLSPECFIHAHTIVWRVEYPGEKSGLIAELAADGIEAVTNKYGVQKIKVNDINEKLDIKPVDFEKFGKKNYNTDPCVLTKFKVADLNNGDLIIGDPDRNTLAEKVWIFLTNDEAKTRIGELTHNKDAVKYINNGENIIVAYSPAARIQFYCIPESRLCDREGVIKYALYMDFFYKLVKFAGSVIPRDMTLAELYRSNNRFIKFE